MICPGGQNETEIIDVISRISSSANTPIEPLNYLSDALRELYNTNQVMCLIIGGTIGGIITTTHA